jgi:hypothetical protein
VRRARPLTAIVAVLAGALLAPALNAQAVTDQSGRRFIDVTVGMGVDLHSASSVADYINLMAQPAIDERLKQFSSAVEFYMVPEMQIAPEWSAGIEYALLLKSYSIDDRSGFSRSEFSYQVHMPTILLHRLAFGEGYRVKLGGGVGYHFANFSQRFPTVGSEETLTAAGFALKLDAVGNTKFDDVLYGSIGIDLRWDFAGTLEHAPGVKASSSTTVALPKMAFFSAGLKFGITFQLN